MEGRLTHPSVLLSKHHITISILDIRLPLVAQSDVLWGSTGSACCRGIADAGISEETVEDLSGQLNNLLLAPCSLAHGPNVKPIRNDQLPDPTHSGRAPAQHPG
jgi:hypothetical protein